MRRIPAHEVLIAGAGPAGLAAAWELSKHGRRAVILEKDLVVGGISRTIEHRGFRFDLGGHRFYTRSEEVRAVWRELLGDRFVERRRLSRIYYRGQFFDYPLQPLDALRKLGPVESCRIVASFIAARLAPGGEDSSFEDWVVRRFGRRLFETFFRTYTEKVWGLPCSAISADWAAQRIQDLDLLRALRESILGDRSLLESTSLIRRFHYPTLGPGMMWETCAERLASFGSPTITGTELVRMHHEGGRIRSIDIRGEDSSIERLDPKHVITSIPLSEVIRRLEPAPPPEILSAARSLRHRDFLTVVLIVDEPEVFPDNWIYVHAPEVRVGRIQNFKNWSPAMVPDSRFSALGLEYFVNREDDLWRASDTDLLGLATMELERLGLSTSDRVVDGVVTRVPLAYPVYDEGYRERVRLLRDHLTPIANLQVVGRNGQHRYNNQDHSMLTGILAARNVLGESHDIWAVNVAARHVEAGGASGGDRIVPEPMGETPLEQMLEREFRRFEPIALGASAALTCSIAAILLTLSSFALSEGRLPVPSLLGAYLYGVEANLVAGLLGFLEWSIGGFLLGTTIAISINFVTSTAEEALREALPPGVLREPRGDRSP